MTLTVMHVVGARPNFVKIAPVLHELRSRGGFRNILIHTGQHYEYTMSDAFFRDLGLPMPDEYLGVGSDTHARQTAAVMVRLERLLLKIRPGLVLVPGDVNSTAAAALAAAKLGIPVAHLEAGLRSGDRRMPEEINRIVTDHVSDLCLTPSRDASENLRIEGIGEDRIHFVGNVMIDSLDRMIQSAREQMPGLASDFAPGSFVLVTLHRPSNVDAPETLRSIVSALLEIARRVPVIFPVHPRTRRRLNEYGLTLDGVHEIDPLPYLEMLSLQANAGLVMTDSGGIQEETTVLGVPCLTLRESTERPITITEGTNRLVRDHSGESILDAFHSAWGLPVTPCRPEGWDGRAAGRVADVLEEWRERVRRA